MEASEVCEKASKQKEEEEKNEEKVPSKQSIEMKGTHFLVLLPHSHCWGMCQFFSNRIFASARTHAHTDEREKNVVYVRQPARNSWTKILNQTSQPTIPLFTVRIIINYLIWRRRLLHIAKRINWLAEAIEWNISLNLAFLSLPHSKNRKEFEKKQATIKNNNNNPVMKSETSNVWTDTHTFMDLYLIYPFVLRVWQAIYTFNELISVTYNIA